MIPPIKNICFLLIFNLFANFVFAQNQIVDELNCNKSLEKILFSYPKKTQNKKDFEIAFNAILELNKLNNNGCKFDINTSSLYISVEKTVAWAIKNEKLKNQLICKKIYLKLLKNSKLYSKQIEIASELLSYKDQFTDQEIYDLTFDLSFAFIRLEAFNEIIKLMAIRKKYCYLDPKCEQVIERELALAYFKTKNYSLAIKGFQLQHQNYIQKQDFLMASSMSNNIGLSFYKKYDNFKAKKHFDIAINELKKVKFIKNDEQNNPDYVNFFEALIKSNKSKIDESDQDYEIAIKDTKNLIAKTKIAGEKVNILWGYLNLSNLYLQKKKLEESEIYLDSAKSSDVLSSFSNHKATYLITKAKVEMYKGNIDNATKFFRNHEKISDSLAEVQVGRENTLAMAKYNFVEKEKELSDANTIIKLKEKSSFIQKIALLIAFLLMLIIGVLYFKTRKKEAIIKIQNSVLMQNINEKEILLKEVHHRVKNNLQVIIGLLQLQSRKTNSVEMLEVFQDSERQISSIALVHQMLYQFEEFAIVGMELYLNELLKQLVDSLFLQKATINIEVKDINLPTNAAVPLGLIVNELMTNVQKYAFYENMGIINISLKTISKNQFEFVFSDNGKGFDENVLKEKPKTLGFKLLKMLAEEMNGTFEIDGKKGTHVKIIFSQNVK